MRVAIILTISLILMVSCSLAQQKSPESNSDEVKGLWNEDVYQIHTGTLAQEVKASWDFISHDPKIENFWTSNTAELLEHFKKQPEATRSLGIFILSNSYLVPATPEEIHWMTETMWKLYNDPVWRKSESDLIDELRTACQKEKITLYVNMSRNLQGKWKVLNRPSNDSSTSNTKPTNRNIRKKP
jgi:hypothetical protein